jgi:hypothetical protein
MCLRWTRRIRWSASWRDGTASPRVPWPSRVPLRQSRQRGRPASLTARHTKAWAMSFRAARYVCAVLPVPEGGWCVVCTVCLCWVACTRGCVVCGVLGMCVLGCLHQRVCGVCCARYVCAVLPAPEGGWCVVCTACLCCVACTRGRVVCAIHGAIFLLQGTSGHTPTRSNRPANYRSRLPPPLRGSTRYFDTPGRVVRGHTHAQPTMVNAGL